MSGSWMPPLDPLVAPGGMADFVGTSNAVGYLAPDQGPPVPVDDLSQALLAANAHPQAPTQYTPLPMAPEQAAVPAAPLPEPPPAGLPAAGPPLPKAPGTSADKPHGSNGGPPFRTVPAADSLAGARAKKRTSEESELAGYDALASNLRAREGDRQELANEAHDVRRAQLAADTYHNLDLQKHDEEASRATGEELASIRAESDRVSQMKIDPRRLMSDQNAGQALIGGLGAALGSLGAALTGGRNMFLDQVNKAVDDDISAQVQNLANAQAGVSRRRSLYGDMLQRFKDERTAKVAAKDATLGNLQRYLEDVKSRSESVQTQANADRMIAGIEQEREKLTQAHANQRILEIQHAQAAALAAQRQVLADQRAERELRVKEFGAQTEADKARDASDQKDRALYSPLVGGFFNSQGAADKFAEKAGAAGEVAQLLREGAALKRQLGKSGLIGGKLSPKSLESDEYKRLSGIAKELRFMKSQEVGQGVVKEYETPDFDVMAGNLEDIGSPANLAEEGANRIGRKLTAHARTIGYRPASEDQKKRFGGTTTIERKTDFTPDE